MPRVRPSEFNDVRAHLTSPALLWTALLALYVAGVVFAAIGSTPYGDEFVHYAQIDRFRLGDFRVYGNYLTMIPGYHLLVAALLKLTGAASLGEARTINALFGLAAILGFHALRRSVQPGTENIATAQFFVLPFMAPWFFLVYTDMLSVALVLWAMLASLRGRHFTSALLLLCAIGVRQNNVVWAAFVALVSVWPLWRERGFAAMREIAARGAWYALPIGAFLGFWAWNGSISLSHAQAPMHPDLSLHTGNVASLLFVSAVLFPLHLVAGVREFAQRARSRPWLLALPAMAFAVFWWTYNPSHPYNAVVPDWCLRNKLALAAHSDLEVRALVGVVIALAVAGWTSLRLDPPATWWLVPFSIGALAATWLIELRYLMIPFALLLAFRRLRTPVVEWTTCALWAVLAVFLVEGLLRGRFSI